MIRYSQLGRTHVQYETRTAVDGVFHWYSRGFVNESVASHARWILYASPYAQFGTAWTYRARGSSIASTATVGPRRRPWRLYTGPSHQLGQVFIWYNYAGTSTGPPPPASTHKRPFHNWSLYDGLYDGIVWQSASSGGATVIHDGGVRSLFAWWLGGGGARIPGTGPPTTHPPFFPPVPEYLPNDDEHRRQMARAINTLRQGKQNVTKDITLDANATSTTFEDSRIGISSAVTPAMALTADGAAALIAGIWVTDIKTGSCVIHHASSPQLDRTIRFLIIG